MVISLRNYINYILAFFIILFFQLSALAETPQTHPTVCLNMIVKNESGIITRCLDSLLPIIDYWVIVDTGSTDGTQKIIRDFMREHDIPGELHERPWVNFGHNRNEALMLAKGKADYICFNDADDYFVYEPNFKLPLLDKDYYYVTLSRFGRKNKRIFIVKDGLDWSWKGVLHEVLCPLTTYTYENLDNISNVSTADGARAKDPERFKKDAQVFEAALKEDPQNKRYVFYLAQSYRDAGDYSQALKNYEKRAKMEGWDEEVFFALYQIGVIQEKLKMSNEVVINSYLRAHEYRKSRIEPLYHLSYLYRTNKDYELAYQTAKTAQNLPPSTDLLFNQAWMKEYGVPLELSVNAYWVGKYEESQQISAELLKRNDLPPRYRTCIEDNIKFANSKLEENKKSQKAEKP